MANKKLNRLRLLCTRCVVLVSFQTWYALRHARNFRSHWKQIACRLLVPQPLLPATKEKISMFCHVSAEQVFGVHDVSSVYHVPLLLQSQGIVEYLRKRLNLGTVTITKQMQEKGATLSQRWKELTSR